MGLHASCVHTSFIAAKKYVEVMVFNDKQRFDLRGAATLGLSNQIMNQVASLYTNALYTTIII